MERLELRRDDCSKVKGRAREFSFSSSVSEAQLANVKRFDMSDFLASKFSGRAENRLREE